MGTYRGKQKNGGGGGGKRMVASKQQPAEEFSEDSDAVFSEEDEQLSAADDDEQLEEALSPAEEESEEEEDEDEDEEALRWGKKSDFFKETGSSEEEDEEDEELAEEEAIRMLKKKKSSVKQEDLEIGGDDDDEDDDEQKGPVVVRKSRKAAAREADGDDELLATEAPEVLALLGEFGTKAAEIRDSIQPILERLKGDRESATKEGVAYLETKTHLLLSYVLNVAFYLMYRAENGAAKAESHPVVGQLVKLRTLLEKLRPLDAKLKNELDELVRRAVSTAHSDDGEEDAGEDEEDEPVEEEPKLSKKSRNVKPEPISTKHGFRPDLNDLMDGPNEVEEDELDAKHQKKSDRQERRRFAKAEKSVLLQELREELSETPTEVLDDLRALKQDSKYEDEKRRYEEENFTRIRETKKMRAKLGKADKMASVHGGDLNALAAELEEGEYDKFKDLLEDDDRVVPKKKGALSMHLNEMAQAMKTSKGQFQSGDDDVLPAKRRLDQSTSRRSQRDDEDGEQNDRRVRFREEDLEVDEAAEHPYFKETVKRRKVAAQEREESYQFPKRYAPAPVRIVEAGETRYANREMIKNRGLMPHRSKDKKNPRKNIRDKYENKIKARRGQVRDVRTGEGDYYQGEQSGIRSSLVRSRQAGKI